MFKNLVNLFNRDNLYQQALHKSHDMLDMDLTMYDASIQSLRQSDNAEINIDIYKMDKELNSFERDVRQKVMTHLAISGGSDLRSDDGGTDSRVRRHRHRKTHRRLHEGHLHPREQASGAPERRQSGGASHQQDIEKRVGHDFREMIGAFKTSDEDKARTIMANYKEGVSSLPPVSSCVLDIVAGNVTDLKAARRTRPQSRSIRHAISKSASQPTHATSSPLSVVNPFPRLGYKDPHSIFMHRYCHSKWHRHRFHERSRSA